MSDATDNKIEVNKCDSNDSRKCAETEGEMDYVERDERCEQECMEDELDADRLSTPNTNGIINGDSEDVSLISFGLYRKLDPPLLLEIN